MPSFNAEFHYSVGQTLKLWFKKNLERSSKTNLVTFADTKKFQHFIWDRNDLQIITSLSIFKTFFFLKQLELSIWWTVNFVQQIISVFKLNNKLSQWFCDRCWQGNWRIQVLQASQHDWKSVQITNFHLQMPVTRWFKQCYRTKLNKTMKLSSRYKLQNVSNH